jgi:transcriptional regulator with XRE-family HTH domain
MPNTPTLGQRIAVARKARHITQQQFARLFEVDHSTISRWERDESFPGMERLDEMARLFQCSRAYLVLGEGEAPEPSAVAS